MRLARAALFTLLFAVLLPPAWARAEIAFIAGTVTDSTSGQPLAGALVRVLDASGRPLGSVSTDASGRYRLGPLAPGEYAVEFSFFGSAGRRVPAVALAAGQTRSLDLALAAREVREEPVV